MSIVFGKLVEKKFTSPQGDFHVYRLRRHGGEFFGAVYRGVEPPAARKTVELEITGEWTNHHTFGKQFEIRSWKKPERRSNLERTEMQLVVNNIKKTGEFGAGRLNKEKLNDAISHALYGHGLTGANEESYKEFVASVLLGDLAIQKGTGWLKDWVDALVSEARHGEQQQ